MPSLQALQEFKASFKHLGGEISSLGAQNITFDDLPLPGAENGEIPAGLVPEAPPKEGAPAPQSANTDLDFNLDDFADMDFGANAADAEPPAETGIAEDDMDFGAFLNTIPDDFPAAEIEAPPVED